jgi:hypothetical protein
LPNRWLILFISQIVPYINGVNSVRIISILADADFSLTCRAIRHLLYYGCVFLLDIFSFSAIYAPTAQFHSTIAKDEEMQRECARYVNTRYASMSIGLASPASSTTAPTRATTGSDAGSRGGNCGEFDDIWPALGTEMAVSESSGKHKTIVDGVGIVELYASLKQGQSVKQWYLRHTRELANIDLRRFITFGVIKGFLYRVHKYPFATGHAARATTQLRSGSYPTSPSVAREHGGSVANNVRESGPSITKRRQLPSHSDVIDRGAATSATRAVAVTATPTTPVGNYGTDEGDDGGDDESDETEEEDESIDDKTLAKYLDGTHCFDQICTELGISEKELTARLKRYPEEVLIIHR